MKNLSDNEQRVIDHLKKHTLTTMQAVTELKIMNVQDCIRNCKRKGYNIDKVWKTSKNKKRFAVYYLVKP